MGYETKSPLLDEAALIPIAMGEAGSWKRLLGIHKERGQTCGVWTYLKPLVPEAFTPRPST